ncbi:MAG: glycosyltransferase family 9 protein [Gammaproteobacteria bacterium]
MGVDTGFMHVAAALGCSGLALYSATRPDRIGVIAASPGAPIHSLARAEALSLEVVKRSLLRVLAGGVDRWHTEKG